MTLDENSQFGNKSTITEWENEKRNFIISHHVNIVFKTIKCIKIDKITFICTK